MISKNLIDTDILIWYLRKNINAYNLIHSLYSFNISVVTYMELIQGMRNKNELMILKRFLKKFNVKIIYINEEISSLASFYVESFYLSHSLYLPDALIAATANNYGLTLYTGNYKDYKFIKDIDINCFRP